jgi:hypothetical protein
MVSPSISMPGERPSHDGHSSNPSATCRRAEPVQFFNQGAINRALLENIATLKTEGGPEELKGSDTGATSLPALRQALDHGFLEES